MPKHGMSFGEAIAAIKAGEKVCREGWNGKGMFIYYVPAAKYPASGNTLGTMKGRYPDDLVPYREYIAMKTAQDDVVAWTASQSDVLSDDWQIAEETAVPVPEKKIKYCGFDMGMSPEDPLNQRVDYKITFDDGSETTVAKYLDSTDASPAYMVNMAIGRTLDQFKKILGV